MQVGELDLAVCPSELKGAQDSGVVVVLVSQGQGLLPRVGDTGRERHAHARCRLQANPTP